jgi:hypothetical protein
MEHVQDLFNNRNIDDNAEVKEPIYPKESYWLFCDSTFLSLQADTDEAFDKNGNLIVDKDGKPKTVMGVSNYKTELRKNANLRAWWSGQFTELKGYFFDGEGGDYCLDLANRGVTLAIRLLEPRGISQVKYQVGAIVICPNNFDGSDQPDSYREANSNLAPDTSLEHAIPKSVTLLHEAFHELHGDTFLAKDEKCV